MSRIKLIFGVLIIAALITAGCAGPKTMVGNEQPTLPAGQSAALNDYTEYAKELTDEINFIKNHYPLSPNATVEEYRAWLDGLGERVDLCRRMYNNTSTAAKKYLGYLNSSSSEYGNVTAADAAYASDIEQLNQSYWQHSEYLNMSVKKMAALEKYRDELNSTMDAYNDLSGLAKGTNIDSMEAYSRYIDNFKRKASAYETCVDAAIKAGDEYAAYCEPESAEHKSLQENNNALRDGVRQCWETYENYKKDYSGKAGAKEAIEFAFKDYINKVGKAAAAKADLDNYRSTAKAMEKLDKSWLEGYKQKISVFTAAGNEAIAAGNACEQYLDPSSQDHESVEANEKSMQDSIAEYNDNYNSLYARYRNLHPLGSFMQ